MEIILSLKTKQTAFCFQICWTITNWIIQYLNREFSIFKQSKFFWKNYVLYLLFKFVERQNRVTDDGKQFGNIWQHRELAHNECPIWTSTKKKQISIWLWIVFLEVNTAFTSRWTDEGVRGRQPTVWSVQKAIKCQNIVSLSLSQTLLSQPTQAHVRSQSCAPLPPTIVYLYLASREMR